MNNVTIKEKQKELKYQHIGDISKQLDVSTRTIRYYEELGLIIPKRSDGGFREYSEIEVEKLKTIIRLKKLGLSLEEIGELIKLRQCAVDKKSVKELLDYLHCRLHEFEGKINEYKEGMHEINELISIVNNCSTCNKQTESFTCTKCLERQNREIPSLMKATL